MKPEIGDRVLVEEWSGSYEGIVFTLPRDSTACFYVGAENGKVVYAKEDQIQVLFRPEYKYVNRCLYKVGDLVTWNGEQALVVGPSDLDDYNYRLSRLNYDGSLTYAREQDLTLIHAAKHPEVDAPTVPVIEFIEGPEPEVEFEGWWGYPEDKTRPPLEQPAPPGWEEPPLQKSEVGPWLAPRPSRSWKILRWTSSMSEYPHADFTIARLQAQLELSLKREAELEALLEEARNAAETYRVFAGRTIQK